MTNAKPTPITKSQHKPHLYEIDLMRLLFICGVLLNHTINEFTGSMASSTALPYYMVESIRLIFHFTRMGFLFMSGLVLMLNYYHRNDWGTFMKKRYKGSIWPYLIWNFIFLSITTLMGSSGFNLHDFSMSYLSYVIHGNQSYMYFMLIIMQLYLLFPGIVWLFRKLEGHHNQILAVSFLVQLAMMFFIKFYMRNVDTSTWLYWFKSYSINVFVYQFYFIAGAYTSLYHENVYAFVKRHIRPIAIVTATLSLGTIVYFRIWNEKILGLSEGLSDTPHQPYMFLYDTCMIVVIFYVGKRYAAWRQKGMPGWLDRMIQRFAKVSFGMYLNQIVGLTLLKIGLSHLAVSDLTLMLLIPVGYLFVLGYSFTLAWFCYKIWPLGIFVGRPQKINPFKRRRTEALVLNEKTSRSK